MEDPDITMEEYTQLKSEKARRYGQEFNWETATYGMVRYFEDVDCFKNFEAEFPAIVYKDALTSKPEISPEPMVSHHHIKKVNFDFQISFAESDDEDYTFMYDKNSFSCKLIFDNDLKSDTRNDNDKINIKLPSEDISIKLLDSGINANADTYSYAFDENFETNRMSLISIIKNLYAPFGIPFNPKRFYKDGVYTRGCGGPDMAPRPPRAKRHPWLRFEGRDYIDVDIQDFKDRLGKIYDRYVHRVHVLDFDILTKEMREAMTDRLRIQHPNAQEQVVFTSHAWRALFGICRPLVQELILELFSTFRIAKGVLDLDAAKTIQFQLGGLRHRITWRQFILALGLHTAEEMGSDTPGKVTTTSLFYLRSMDEGVSGERPLLANAVFVRVLGLTMVVHDLTMIDMDELVRLHIYERLGDVETWVAPGLERQQDHRTKDIEIGGGVHRLRNNFGEQRVVVDTMSRDFARFSTWVVGRLRQLLDARDVTYPRYGDSHVPYRRRV
uniref:Uncharacterized protein n=1 Tax=Tanacetum cinerariifolium TaxID=118510 RepID=A0A699HLJ7_TANCI|nr:hypothetical protein [Tanacetum cinerariifolium]